MHCGPTGAGHFVKMIHNGIEYGLMAAYAEGFDMMRSSGFGPGLDLAKVASLWMRGSVVRSWLLGLLADALARDPGLAGIEGYVEDSGEGRWTVAQAVETAVPAPVITASLYQRFRSRRGDDAFADRVLAALRREFGGHAVVARKKR
jgi:6-phosphogluconate dehydrogenase